MRNKVAKKLRRLTKHIDDKVSYDPKYKPVKYTPIFAVDKEGKETREVLGFNKTRGVPLELNTSCARSVYKVLKKNYNNAK